MKKGHWKELVSGNTAYIREEEMRSNCIRHCQEFGSHYKGEGMLLKEVKQKKRERKKETPPQPSPQQKNKMADKMSLYFNTLTTVAQ